MTENRLKNLINEIKSAKSILFLTGAGVSAESGLPTFRGEEGYWKIGSKNYFPEEMATLQFFNQNPSEVWKWYRHRQKIYLKAKPNRTHQLITNFEMWCKLNKKKFLLVTQNVDDLHIRAETKNIIEIHGNIFKYRCSDPLSNHSNELFDFKIDDLDNFNPVCFNCKNLLRPHVLWFDEYYDEKLYQAQTALEETENADLIFIIGTTLKTTIPSQMAKIMFNFNKSIIEINPKPVLGSQIKYSYPLKSSIVMENIIKNLK